MPINKNNPLQQNMLKAGYSKLAILRFYLKHHTESIKIADNCEIVEAVNWHKKQAKIYEKDINNGDGEE